MSKKSLKIARQNGAKAAGSKTPEGIKKSAMNALRHGLTGTTLVLSNESQVEFDLLTQRYIKKFQPQDEVDMELIEDLAAARWRMNRIRLMETAAIDLEMDRQADDISAEFDGIDEPTRSTLAFTELANKERTLQLMHRYEMTYVRQYNRTLKLLESRLEKFLRNDPKSPSEPIPTEPQTPQTEPPAPQATQINTPKPASGAGFQPAGRFEIGLSNADAPPNPSRSPTPLGTNSPNDPKPQ